MRGAETGRPVYRFEDFELDNVSGELRKNGVRIRLQDQPLQILLLLLEHAGELVTREQIQNRLWAPGTYVDYDNAINSAMRKLRESLGDDSGDPRFIETFARRGYRFIGKLEEPPKAEQPAAPPERLSPNSAPQKSNRGLIAGASVAAFVLMVVLGWWLWRRPALETQVAPTKPVPLTAASGWEWDPSLSPDGKQVAYRWDEGKGGANYHIYLKLVGEGKPVRLTSGSGPEFDPAWSPDGRTIAFSRITDVTQQKTQILTIPVLGGEERLVAEGPFNTNITWSPDGRFLVVSQENPQSNSSSLFLVSVEGSDKLFLTVPPDGKVIRDLDPAFSPQGESLLFTRCDGIKCGLYLLSLSLGYKPAREPTLLREESGSIDGTTWTPSGEEVIYSHAEVGLSGQLMRIRAQAGSRPEPLTFGSDNALLPSTASQRNRLVYSQALYDWDISQVHSGEAPRSFASSTRAEDSPQYSPDGHRVAFASSRSGLQQVWACDADGQNQVQLTHFDPGASGTPRWSPDGGWIAFDHREKGGWRIFVMARDGGQVRRLADDEGFAPSWSSDGKWIYYSSDRTGRSEIWKRPARGGEPIQLTHLGGYMAFESHDGQSLYYAGLYPHSGLWKLPFAGEAETKVLESVYGRAFVVVDDGIYYIPDTSADGTRSVRFHSFATHEDQEVSRLGQAVYMGIAVSPDRKTILFTSVVRTGSNIMVVDNFR
jgi:Tol biopolymer transport system component/DNA-binding winged helix-turn-helix (wHTH) protein